MAVSTALSVAFTVSGLALSYAADITSGAAAVIAVASVCFFFLSFLLPHRTD